jgi:hypothetical protein
MSGTIHPYDGEYNQKSRCGNCWRVSRMQRVAHPSRFFAMYADSVAALPTRHPEPAEREKDLLHFSFRARACCPMAHAMG